MKSARKAAFDTLYAIFQDNAYSNIALDKALNDVESADRAFTSSLVYGVTERRLTLDWLLERFLSGRTKPKVKVILYIGAYQLCFMDKVPASAAVNESVKLAEATGCGYYKGLINAVLHKVDEQGKALLEKAPVPIAYSCPEPLMNMWRKMYGEEAAIRIARASLGKPPVFAVPNLLYVDAEELQYELLDEGIECETDGKLVRILSSFNLGNCRSFQNGLFHIEDKSAFECACALDTKRGDTVVDLCAAPGGKTFTVAERMQNEGTVYSFDLHEHRVQLIREGAEMLGLTCVKAAVHDALDETADIPAADAVLCDVPCSGFGIIRRKPEIRYKALDSVKELPELQYRILCAGSKLVKTGGRLVYATCTLNKKENEKVVSRFTENNGGFERVCEKTILPDENGGDGFYYAVLEKKE